MFYLPQEVAVKELSRLLVTPALHPESFDLGGLNITFSSFGFLKDDVLNFNVANGS